MKHAKYPTHSPAILAALQEIGAERDKIMNIGLRVMESGGGAIYPLDLLACGTIKRYLNTAAGFQLMIETWNMACGRALLRMHIDTALRFSAAWLVEDPHTFASRVVKGERIDRFKDARGNRLTDAYLVNVHTADHPWLPAVYKSLSGYVHLSASHVFDSVASLEKDSSTISFALSETDTKFPDFSWLEIAECFIETSGLLGKYLLGYARTKDATG